MRATRKPPSAKAGGMLTLLSAISAAAVAIVALGVSGETYAQQQPSTKVANRLVSCGAADRVEPGKQGQTSLADRMSGANKTPYNCNMDFVGNWTGEGAEWQMAWFKD